MHTAPTYCTRHRVLACSRPPHPPHPAAPPPPIHTIDQLEDTRTHEVLWTDVGVVTYLHQLGAHKVDVDVRRRRRRFLARLPPRRRAGALRLGRRGCAGGRVLARGAPHAADEIVTRTHTHTHARCVYTHTRARMNVHTHTRTHARTRTLTDMSASPRLAFLCQAMPIHPTPRRAVPCRAVLYRAGPVPCRASPCRAVPWLRAWLCLPCRAWCAALSAQPRTAPQSAHRQPHALDRRCTCAARARTALAHACAHAQSVRSVRAAHTVGRADGRGTTKERESTGDHGCVRASVRAANICT